MTIIFIFGEHICTIDIGNCLIDFMPLCQRLNLEDVKDTTQYETLLQCHFPKLLEVLPRDITTTLLQNNIITYVRVFYSCFDNEHSCET